MFETTNQKSFLLGIFTFFGGCYVVGAVGILMIFQYFWVAQEPYPVVLDHICG